MKHHSLVNTEDIGPEEVYRCLLTKEEMEAEKEEFYDFQNG